MKNEIKRKLVSIFFPERCPYCRKVIKPCEIACEECVEKLPNLTFLKIIVGEHRVFAAVPYKDKYKTAILNLKANKKKQYAYQLAKLMAKRLSSEIDTSEIDVITFVPLHEDTLKERGFNQSELLAKYIGEILDIPCTKLLIKTRKTKPQHELKADKREKNVEGAFKCTDKKLVKGRKILIIDDIVTTGFTLSECAKVLTNNKADKIFGMTFAITLPKTT